ncbi:MAG: type II secretion system F family protein [bacterium]
MDKFHYTAKTPSGTITEGEQEAASRKAAAEAIFAKKLTPITIDLVKSSQPIGKALSFLPSKRVPLRERVLFSRQFATMISAGIPIVRALNVLKNQTENSTLKSALAVITKDVESGRTLSSSMVKFPKIFSQVYVSMVHAGEIGGMLDQVLERLADQMEKDAELVSKVRSAMVYPGLIFCVMIVAFVFIMTVVVPQLSSIFEQVDTELPWNTKLLLAMSKSLQDYGIWIGIGIIVVIYGVMRWIKSSKSAKLGLDKLILRTPVLSIIVKKINLARFARTLGTLLGSGIPVLEALKVVSDSISNLVIRRDVRSASRQVKNGSTLAKALHGSKVFPTIVPEMIAVGEETGELEKILLKLASFYDKEVNALVENLSSVIEPIMLIIMGLLVGFIIVSVIGPLYQLTGAF